MLGIATLDLCVMNPGSLAWVATVDQRVRIQDHQVGIAAVDPHVITPGTLGLDCSCGPVCDESWKVRSGTRTGPACDETRILWLGLQLWTSV